jgi:hypothetical protein
MTESISISVDVQSVVEWMESTCPKSVGFAVSYGLNQLANVIQDRIRQGIIARFKLQRKTWILNRVYISKQDRASKTDWSVTISISEPRDILSKFEYGGEHVPFEGHNHLAIPNAQVFKSVIRSDDPLTIRNLAIKETKPNHLQGLYGSFIVKDKTTGTPLVLQDMSAINYKNAGNLKTLKKLERGMKTKDPRIGNRILYTLVKSSKVPAKLEFIDTAKQAIDANCNTIMSNAVQEAIRTSK